MGKNYIIDSEDTVVDITANDENQVKEKKMSRRADIIARILSIVFAIILWFFVMSVESPTSEQSFSGVEVIVENASALQSESKLSVVSGATNTVDVVLRGKKSTLNRLNASDISAYVDLSAIDAAGEYSLEIRYSMPEGTEFVSANISTVSIFVDETVSVSVPVEIVLNDYIMDDGYELGIPEAGIRDVTVQGSASTVSHITKALVTLSSIGRITESFSANKEIVLCDENNDPVPMRYVTLKTTTVRVRVPVYIRKQVPLTVAYKFGYFNDTNVNITIKPATITILGESSAVSAVDHIEIATLDEKSFSGDAKMSSAVIMPDGVENVDEIDRAEISVKHVNTVTKTMLINSIQVNNPYPNITYSIANTSVKVRVRCDAEKSVLVNMDNVVALLDLSSIGTQRGTIEMPLMINFVNDANGVAYELGEYTVTATISDILPPEEI